jgi:hypothetical protein
MMMTKARAVHFFKTSGIDNPAIQHNNPEGLNPQLEICVVTMDT